MRKWMRRRIGAIAMAAAALAGGQALADQPYAGMTLNLASMNDPFATTWGLGINDSGIVVGQSTFQSTYHAFVYSGGKMKDLGTLSGPYSTALAPRATACCANFSPWLVRPWHARNSDPGEAVRLSRVTSLTTIPAGTVTSPSVSSANLRS